MNQPNLGAVYAIPGGGKYAFGKVIFLSQYFKDVVLIRLFLKSCSTTEPPPTLEEFPSKLYFTGVESISKGKWVHVGVRAVGSDERKMSRRIVGGDVWVEDTHVGPASAADRASLPNMDVYGYRLIEKAVTTLP